MADDGRSYERCDRAVATIGRRPIIVLREPGPLGEWVVTQLRSVGGTITDLRIANAATIPADHLVCWVSDDEHHAPAVVPVAATVIATTIAVAPYGYHATQREKLSSMVGERVVWAPAGRYELLELLAEVAAPAGAPATTRSSDRDAEIADWTRGDLNLALDAVRREYHLASREAEVCRGMAVGLTNRQIAAQLRVGLEMVRKAGNGCRRKLRIRSRTEVRWVLARMLGSPPGPDSRSPAQFAAQR